MKATMIGLFDTIIGDGCYGFSILQVTRLYDETYAEATALFSVVYVDGRLLVDLFWVHVL